MLNNAHSPRPLEVTNRHIWIGIMEMIQKDVVKALVEFITNSDDSYARLEAAGQLVTGRIQVEVMEKRGGDNSIIRVIDDAEGFDAEALNERLGSMGKDTSGHADGFNVRGFFGDGLKEGVLGLQRGGILRTIKNGLFAEAKLTWDDKTPIYHLQQASTKVSTSQRQEYDLHGDGTNLTVYVAPEIRLPRHDSLVENLSRHYALREILQNPNRTIVVKRISAGGGHLSSDEARYREPCLDEDFSPVSFSGTVPNYDADFELTVKRATEPLSGAEAGPSREGGLLVKARRAVIDVGFFGHENKPGTEYLFGELTCDHLYERLRDGDVVINKNRSGLNRSNNFVKALLSEVKSRLEPIVKKEADRLRKEDNRPIDAKSRKQLSELKEELNRIAQLELDEEGEEVGGDSDGTPALRFTRQGYRLYPNDSKTIRIRASEEAVEQRSRLELSTSGTGLQITPTSIELSAKDAVKDIVVAEAELSGALELDAGLVEARLGKHEAVATVVVRPRPVLEPFAFEHDTYRVPVAKWKELSLRIHVPSVSSLPAEVGFKLKSGNLKLRSDAQEAKAGDAKAGWLTIHVSVLGDQIGAKDVIEAQMGQWRATANLNVVSGSQSPPDRKKGGLIQRLTFDAREEPVQRTRFQDGEITIFVEHPSVRQYLSNPQERTRPAGRALLADLVMQAFCRYIAEQTYGQDPFASDPQSAIQTVFSTYEKMVKKYGRRIHKIMSS